jgi:hypothetical protein
MLNLKEESEFLSKLLESKKKIDAVLVRHSKILQSIKEENIVKCDTNDILKFAHNNTPVLFAPKGWIPGCSFGHPPAPQIEQMRKGLLGNFSSACLKLENIDLANTQENETETIQLNSFITSSTIIENIDMEISSNNLKESEEIQFEQKVVNSRFQSSTANASVAKKARVINMNYGFSSDSESDESEEN